MLVKPLSEQKVDSMQQLHNEDEKKIISCVDAMITQLIDKGSEISNLEEFYKQLNISSKDLYNIKWIKAIMNHSELFISTSFCKSSSIKHKKVHHVYFNVFERLLFELDLFHLFFAYDVTVDKHSPWDNLNPSSIFILCGNLQKLYEKSQPTASEIALFFEKSARFHPILKYKYINSDNWSWSDTFINVNVDISNDYNFVSRILHPQLFDEEKDDDAHTNEDIKHIMKNIEEHKNRDNHFCYEIYLMDKEHNNEKVLVHTSIRRDTFNVDTNEELSRNMFCPSLYLSTGHVLGARKWIPESDLYGTVCIKANHTIMIEKSSCLTASGAGYTSHYGKGHGTYYKEPHKYNQGSKYYSGGGYGTSGADAHKELAKGGKVYGDEGLKDILCFGSPSGGRERGGGIVEIFAKYIINYGKISCDGDSGKQFGGGAGGSIKIMCKIFINYGKITANGGKGGVYERRYETSTALRVGGNGGDGRIAIYCDKYINKGVIAPNPNVTQITYNDEDQGKVGFTALSPCKDNQFYQ